MSFSVIASTPRCIFVSLSALLFVFVSFRFFSVLFRHIIIVSSFRRFVVSSLRYVVSSLRMNRDDLGTILTTLNMAAMEHGATSNELKAFIHSNIQQILNGVNNNLMDEKDGVDYVCCDRRAFGQH